jgi:hypothetical protein
MTDHDELNLRLITDTPEDTILILSNIFPTASEACSTQLKVPFDCHTREGNWVLVGAL